MRATGGREHSRTSAYDAAAPSFERHRALPTDVAQKIRAAVLAQVDAPRPRILDLGAGTGRIGWPFVGAGDDYVGIDLSYGMLRAFAKRAENNGRLPRLVQSDGALLPFPERTFDAVMLVQVFGGPPRWRRLLAEARRVVRSDGALMVGRTVAPADGVDEQMKHRLAALLGTMGVQAPAANARDEVQRWLESVAYRCSHRVAATWTVERTPQGFLERHRTGARFSALPAAIKEEALGELAAWAVDRFGSLDAPFAELHAFELRVFKLRQEAEG